jgi:Tfp pilus assembly pilus retraction ATPase PilT
MLQSEPPHPRINLLCGKVQTKECHPSRAESRTEWGLPMKNIYALTTPYREPVEREFFNPASADQELIASLLKESEKVSDIFLSPMRPPEVRANGQILAAGNSGIPALLPEDTRRIAQDLIGHRPRAQPKLESQGSCDFAFFLPRLGRFRVNIFSQRGSYAITLCVIPDPVLPTFEGLSLPPQIQKLVHLRSGLVVASGPAGSGKSSTLAAILKRINEEKEVHIVTIEDPIEFLFRHKKATVLAATLRPRLRDAEEAMASKRQQP